MSERSPRYHHVLRYQRTLKRWKNANLGEGVRHGLAVIEARKAFPPEHQEINKKDGCYQTPVILRLN